MSADQVPVGSKVTAVKGFQKIYSAADVAAHNTEHDCWMTIHGRVYDCSNFLVDHPGGPEILTNEGGTDATAKFEEVFHSDDARAQLKDWCIGTLEGYTGPLDAATNRKKKSSGQATTTQGTNPAVYLLAAAAVGAIVYFLVL